jgi:hypothetical protein
VRIRRIVLLLICFVTLAFIASISFSAAAAAKSEDSDLFSGPDFAFKIPERWTVSAPTGGPVAGNLSLIDSCARISLNWSRDPGMNLREILNQIKGAYDGGGVKILSSELGERSSEGRRVETLHMIYEFNGYRNEKRFAIWNSSKSDRLFLASLSRCNNIEHDDSDNADSKADYARGRADNANNNANNSDNKNNNIALFDGFVDSFSDLGKGETAKLRATSPAGAWGIVLGDLLSSYHYEDAKTLPGRTVRVSVLHSLTPQNGIYVLDSQEAILVEPQVVAAARAGAVQEILQQAGYDAWLVQMGGEVAVSVRDPLGGWQKVSINPTSPERMIGVQANSTGEALMYSDLAQLAAANGITDKIDMDSIVQEDCEPSNFVELKAQEEASQSWLDNLTGVLDSYEYDKYYEENVFDCSNTAQMAWSQLQQNGYDARLMMSYDGHPLDPHMWVVVKYPNEAERYVRLATASVISSVLKNPLVKTSARSALIGSQGNNLPSFPSGKRLPDLPSAPSTRLLISPL